MDKFDKFIKQKTTFCTHSKSNEIEFKIITYTVLPTDPDGNLPLKKHYRNNFLDDNTYVKYPELIKMIPRGFSEVYVDDKLICKLDGLEKFDGSCPLDDDEECSSNIFKQNSADIANWKNLKVEFLEKANGKMAIFKIFSIYDKYFILGGSKNVHIVVGIDDKINGTELDLHCSMLKLFQEDLRSSKHIIESLVNQTIIGEYVDGKHIVYVDKPYLVYFSGPLKNIKHLMPVQNCLPTEEQLQKIRYLENTEGAVIVYTNLDTGTVYRQKHKTIWYILIRVMREGLRHYTKEIESGVIITKVFGIFKKRSNDFLALTDDDFAKWYTILKNFVFFIKQSKYDFPDLDVQKLGIGIIWHEFVNSTITDTDKITDTIAVTITDPIEFLQDSRLIDYVYCLYQNEYRVCIIMRGLPGSGKSSVVKHMTNYLSMKCFSTDDFFMVDKDGEVFYKFEAEKLEMYHGQNFLNFKNSISDNVQVVCVDNTNLNYHEYGKYLELARKNGYITVIMNCKKFPPEIHAARSIHAVPFNSIVAKHKKYMYVEPVYYGIFFTESTMQKLLADFQLAEKEQDYKLVQKTVFHVTLFFGKEQFESNQSQISTIGTKYSVKIISFCTNAAGKYIKVQVNEFENILGLHITLETNQGFKPVDVGIMQPDSEVHVHDKMEEIVGIFGPIY